MAKVVDACAVDSTLKDAQALLDTPITNEMYGIELYDSAVSAVCEGPGIFTIIWARRGFCLENWIILVISIFIQICVPLILVNNANMGEHSEDLDVGVRVVAFALTLYLCSTFSCTLDRVLGKVTLAYYIQGWRWILGLGSLTLYASIILTTAATFVLFEQAPDTSDLLLNCVALNFIVDVDVALVGIIKCLGFGHLGVSLHRLGKLEESWTETSGREQLRQYLELSIMEKFRTSPMLLFINVLNQTFTLGLFASAVYFAYAM